ncbi:hypothetical protein BBJ28_00016617 [Nothophytophthora sp. Chile5]|nr:hypothetical protein BBJ28_00016617 [Nothophytophthora sp. Chile5]
MAPQPLSGVAFVLRDQRAVSALPHVADIISSFLVPTSSMSLAEACRFGSLKLLDHIWAASCSSIADRKPWWSLTNYLRSDRHYHAWAFTVSLREAASLGDLEVVKWLFAHFPGCTAEVKVVEAAAEAGHLHILQFLHANSTAVSYEYANQDRQHEANAGMGFGSAITVFWGCNDMTLAAQNGHLEIVRWLYEHSNTSNAHRDTEYALSTALRFNDLAFVDRLLAPIPPDDTNFIAQAAVQLAGSGHLELILPLHERLRSIQWGSYYWKSALEAACRHGHLNAVKLLLEQWPGTKNYSGTTWMRALRDAITGGHLEVVQYLAERINTRLLTSVMSFAVSMGHLSVVQWLQAEISERLAKRRSCRVRSIRNQNVDVTSWTSPNKLRDWINAAAGKGHLEMLQYLRELSVTVNPRDCKRRRDEEALQHGEKASRKYARKHCTTDTAPTQSRSEDSLEIIANSSDGCTVAEMPRSGPSILAMHVAMDRAAAKGHLDVVQWLLANGLNTCTTAAMDGAAAAGHLEMVQWLHTSMQAECTPDAMDRAAVNGHLKIVQWLHTNRSEGCTTKAMNGAASSGHLEIVKWLHANRPEGCTSAAVENAVMNRHLRIVRWLFAHSPPVVPTSWTILRQSNFDTLLFLHSHCPEVFSTEAVEILRAFAPNHVAEWLEEHYPGDEQ